MRPPAGLAGIADRVTERLPDVLTDRLADPMGRAHPERPPTPRVLVVTGASSGIGRAVAHEAAVLGDHLVLSARDDESLEEVARECVQRGAASTLVVPTDVGDDEAVAALVERTLAEHGRIDAVVNSAGVVAYGPAEEVPREVFDRVLRTNLVGSANVARHVVPVLRRQERGTLVLVGSVLGSLAAPAMTPYVVSKWGVRGLARQLQIENRDVPGVHVCLVAPGGVDTPIYDQGANYAGVPGQPPLSVTPEHVARRLLRRLDSPPPELQVGIGNDMMRFGFSFLPRTYDALVGPVFGLVGLDTTRRRPADDGNVLESHPEGNAVRGDYDTVVQRVGRTVLARARALSNTTPGR
jgi:NAD(P)-dependent dehydrogenase (short-subunit alcohol dehydrogenase family)